MLRTIPIIVGRLCGSCTACCEGWLFGDAYGFKFNIGKPCKFLNKRGCSIYEVRPADPCKTFLCHWKENTGIPEWLQPNKSNVIIIKRSIGNFIYLRLINTGKVIEEQVYVWADEMAEEGKHIVLTDLTGIKLFSKNKEFIELAKKELGL